jgi:heme-degrading monooxygenase HmoA
MDVMRPETEESPYLVMTVWENEQAFRAWVGSEDFRLAHQNPLPKEAYNGEGKMEAHTIVISAGSNSI